MRLQKKKIISSNSFSFDLDIKSRQVKSQNSQLYLFYAVKFLYQQKVSLTFCPQEKACKFHIGDCSYRNPLTFCCYYYCCCCCQKKQNNNMISKHIL